MRFLLPTALAVVLLTGAMSAAAGPPAAQTGDQECPFEPRQPCNEASWVKVAADWRRVQSIPARNLILRKGGVACTSAQSAWDAFRYLLKDDITAFFNNRDCIMVRFAVSVQFSRGEPGAILSDIYVPLTRQYFSVLTVHLLDRRDVPASDFTQ
jgi:hypothetical protein